MALLKARQWKLKVESKTVRHNAETELRRLVQKLKFKKETNFVLL